MLQLYFGELKGTLYSGNGYFDNWVDDRCVESEFGRKIIKEVDKSEVISSKNIVSEVIGAINSSYLSGGVKSLLILMFDNKVVDITAMGENCYKYIWEIAKVKDIVITSEIPLRLYEHGGNGQSIKILNDNSMAYNDEELIEKYFAFIK